MPLSLSFTARLALALFTLLPSSMPALAESQIISSTATPISASASSGVDVAGIQKLLTDRDPGGTVGLYVIDGGTSTVLLDVNAAEALRPASNNKLLTTAAGLSLLGPDYRFVTRISTRGPVLNGTLQGDLIIRGGGDPTISGRFEADKRDVTAIFRRWAEAITSAGISRITGDIVGDDTFFDSEYYHAAWPGGERGEWYSAEVSGLSFNDNCIDLSWSGKNKVPGDFADFRLNPVTNYAQIENKVQVLAKGRSTERYYERPAVLNDILCRGSMTVDTTKDDSAAVHDGGLYAVTVLRDVLTSQGIQVTGRARKPSAEVDATTPPVLLFEHRSPPLTEVVNVINRNSQNFYAECLLKTLGRELRHEGSFAAGATLVEDFVRSCGLFNAGHEMVDGSGLTSRNRVSPRQLVEVIRFMDKGPHSRIWRESLPVGQVSGTLRTRFGSTTESVSLAPRILAKTGTIRRVRSLSGIINRPNTSPLYFSILLNGYEAPDSKALQLIDDIAIALARDPKPANK